MKTLLLMRHAKSSWADESLDDHQRPLNNRGKRDAPRMGKHLVDQGLVPDVIVSSTARRARKTAALVAEHCGYDGKVAQYDLLYHASPEAYFRVLQDVPADAELVMAVAHNPGMEQMLEVLTGEWETMPTAALAEIELPIERWGDIAPEMKGRLVNFWRPRELKAGESA